MSYGWVKKKTERVFQLSPFQYPDPGSNRDGLPHWCLRPARLPIPPSGQFLIASAKVVLFFVVANKKTFFLKKSCKYLPIMLKRSNFASRLLSAHTMGRRCFRSLSRPKRLNLANWSGTARRGFLQNLDSVKVGGGVS